MTFDRSKFKATQAATLKQADREVDAVVRNKRNSADYIDIKNDEAHKLRIYPFHPEGGGNAFAESKVVVWLQVESPERDNEGNLIKDEKTGKSKMRVGPKPIFSSKVHGDTEKDIVEEYIKFAEKIGKESNPKDEKAYKEFIEPVHGSPFTSKGPGKHKGIMYKQSWVMYVDEINANGSKTFGRVDIVRAVKRRLNAISASEAANEPLGTDPFTDIVNGRAVIVTYNSKAKQADDYWTTEIDASFDKKTQKVNLYPLSDEDLERFMKYPSLASMFKNVYKRRDFDLAMEGLKRFDDENHMGVFQYDEFLNIAEEISNYYPEETLEEQQRTGKDIDKMFTGKNKGVPAEREPDPFDDMDRQELKEYCRDERTGIIVTNKLSDDEVRTKLREWYDSVNTAGIGSAGDDVAERNEKASDLGGERQSKGVIDFKSKLKSKQAEAVQEANDDGLPWDENGNDKQPRTPEVEAKPKLSAAERIAQIRKNVKK